MNESYLQDLSRESKELAEKLQILTKDEVYYNNIVCAAPLAELRLKKIKQDKKIVQSQLDALESQAKEARLQIAISEGFTLKIGGIK